MKPRNITNSKYKNTGVLFELLVRQITADTLAGKSDSPAMDIMRRRFNTKTELGKEVQLYHAFFGNRELSESKAINFIDLLCEQRKRLDEKQLAREKYDLVKDIKAHYPLKEFLSSRIPNYTINASIYKTFATEATDVRTSIMNIRDVSNARFTLVEHLSGRYKAKAPGQTSELLQEFAQQSEDLRLLTYRVMVEKFNEKYGNLDASQKTLLREYINNVTATGTINTHVEAELPKIELALTKLSKTCSDKVMQIKLNEVATQIGKISTSKGLRDNHVTALMIAYEIIKELSSGAPA